MAGGSRRSILLLPGMGADARLFDPLKPWLGEIVVPDWSVGEGAGTIPEWAQRIANWLPERVEVIGGASFGGAVAGRIASRLAKVPPGQSTLFGLTNGTSRTTFRAMLHDTPGRRLQAMVEALASWDAPGNPCCPIVRFHGTRDFLIQPRGQVDHWIKGAGHAFTLTHASVVGPILQKRLQGFPPM